MERTKSISKKNTEKSFEDSTLRFSLAGHLPDASDEIRDSWLDQETTEIRGESFDSRFPLPPLSYPPFSTYSRGSGSASGFIPLPMQIPLKKRNNAFPDQKQFLSVVQGLLDSIGSSCKEAGLFVAHLLCRIPLQYDLCYRLLFRFAKSVFCLRNWRCIDSYIKTQFIFKLFFARYISISC